MLGSLKDNFSNFRKFKARFNLTMKASIDNFSSNSAQYAQFRPDYPAELYHYLYSRVKNFDCAWDCGTGNGQVALVLAEPFQHVNASDLSAAQIEQALPHPRVQYNVCRAELSPYPDHQFDLITVAQALHWFDFEAFYQEVRRVAKPGAVLAAWSYGLLKINPVIDPVIQHFYTTIIGPYWDAERHHVDEAYARIPFPFSEVEERSFSIQRRWNLEELCGYLRTWSSVKKYRQRLDIDPVADLALELGALWQDSQVYDIQFPVFLKSGIV